VNRFLISVVFTQTSYKNHRRLLCLQNNLLCYLKMQ